MGGRISPEAEGRAARFACDEVVRLPERKARTPKGPQGAERSLEGFGFAAVDLLGLHLCLAQFTSHIAICDATGFWKGST